jgi:hypothetical protein
MLEYPDGRQLARLRTRSERPTGGRATEQGDKFPPSLQVSPTAEAY